MRIRLSQLRQIIKEETRRALNETGSQNIAAFDKMLGGMSKRATELKDKKINEYTPEEIQYFTSGIKNIAEEWMQLTRGLPNAKNANKLDISYSS
jgi:hypothetical protein